MSEKLKLIVLSGLPGAGKSTKARELTNETGALIVSRDDLRKHLGFIGENELSIRLIQFAASFLRNGISIIIDAQNLNVVDREYWTALASEAHAQLRWIHLDTDLGECVARDSRRPTPNGEAVVRQTASDNLLQLQNLAREGREADSLDTTGSMRRVQS